MVLQYNRIFGNMKPQLRDMLIEIHETKALIFQVDEPQDFKIWVKNNNKLAKAAEQAGISGLLECYISSMMLGNGPKLFCPDRLNLEAMENIEINIQIPDYHQPYDTMCVELPDDYIRKKVAYCPQFEMNHNPILVIVHHDPSIKILICGIYFHTNTKSDYTNQVITFSLLHEEGKMIEDLLNKSESKLEYIGSEKIDESELKIAYGVGRAAINALGILYETGCRRVSSASPEHYCRLKDRIAKRSFKNRLNFNSEEKRKLEQDKKELSQIPDIYDFVQKVRLYTSESSIATPLGLESKIKLKPHWRRGYRRRQHYGPGNQLIKVVTIKPVLVNFGGKSSDTLVEYK